jgi:hypothetical protein
LYGRPLACVKLPNLNAGGVGVLTHLAAKRVDFPYQVALTGTAHGRIAGHESDTVEIEGEDGSPAAHARGRERRLAPSVPGPDYDDVIFCRLQIHELFVHSILPGPVAVYDLRVAAWPHRDRTRVISGRSLSSARRALPSRWSVALVVTLVLVGFLRPASAHAQTGRWLWYANDSGWHHAYVLRLATGPHVAVYAEQGTVSLHDARMIADAFSWRIYPRDTSAFGDPSGLASVSIALLPLGGITLGYFNEDDVAANRPGADMSHSNRSNVLYVRTPSTMPDSTRLADVGEVVAHELQHLIDFRTRVVVHTWVPEDDWLNEGLSVYAQFANHYFTRRDALKVQAAAANPGWQLTALNSSNASVISHARAA